MVTRARSRCWKGVTQRRVGCTRVSVPHKSVKVTHIQSAVPQFTYRELVLISLSWSEAAFVTRWGAWPRIATLLT